MKTSIVLVTAGLLVGAVGLAQVRITSFDASGEITWTNSIYRGLYSVESGPTPAGPWSPFGSVVDSDWARTNHITLQVPLANTRAFYRVGWVPPDPIGVWDYRGYDMQGALVITGQLSLTSTTLVTSNPPVVYRVRGSWNFQYAGPATNELWWLGPQLGTGYFGGTLESQAADLSLSWPTNVSDDNIRLSRDIWANTYTGLWLYVTWAGPRGGRFEAVRVPSTNSTNIRPYGGVAGKGSDKLE